MTNVEELTADTAVQPQPQEVTRIQPAGYFLELSLDWMVLRASENVHQMLGEFARHADR